MGMFVIVPYEGKVIPKDIKSAYANITDINF